MDARLDALLAALTRIDDPGDLRHLPEPGALPSPWETWTLIGLARHRGRQLWVADLVRTRLRGAPSDLAAVGALGHPEDVPQLGPVPGMPEWEYYFHGRGCRVTHKVDGGVIDVDFYGDTAEYFDTYFYTNYLESLRRPEPPERRLVVLHPSARTITLAIASLLAAGALTPLGGRDSHPYRLADGVLDALDTIDAFCAAWADPGRRARLAALIGDWPAADETAPAGLSAITAPRAGRCRELWRQRLHRDLKIPFVGADALQALADLKAPDLDRCLGVALREPPSGIVSAALAVIGKADDAKWCDRVYALFARVDPLGPLPQPHIWMTSLKFLLRHGYRTAEMTAALAKAGRTEVGEAVLLALEHAPELALPLIRRGLLSDVPMDRAEVAAILALVGKPWSVQELLGALKASDDQERTADSRAALLEAGDPQAEKAVLEWEEMDPHEPEAGSYLEIGGRRLGPFYSAGEHALKNRGKYIRYEMGKLHDRVMALKNVVPPEPQGRKP
ncbi:hypothetical protein J0H58_16840 [bacterium]|nr:hypothetical protein [bacterium]